MAFALTPNEIEAISQRVAEILAKRIAGDPAISGKLRRVYTAEQFAEEVLGGSHHPRWVRKQCRLRQIKTVGVRPFLIPQSEALRFVNPALKKQG